MHNLTREQVGDRKKVVDLLKRFYSPDIEQRRKQWKIDLANRYIELVLVLVTKRLKS